MKKKYISPATQVIQISIASHLLIESAGGSITIDREQSVSTALVKENNPSYNVWDDDWSN